MKKTYIVLLFIAMVIAFVLGNMCPNRTMSTLIEHNNAKKELIKLQQDALDKAAIIMDQNDLYDIDGSDAMSEYLEATSRVEDWYSANAM